MADLAFTSTDVALLNNTPSIRLAGIAGEALKPGDLTARDKTDGRIYKADADNADRARCNGMALGAVQAGAAFTRLVQGAVAIGKTALATKDPDAPVYVSANPGKISDTKAAAEQQVGQIELLTDGKTPTRYLWLDCSKH